MRHALFVVFHFPPEASSSGVLRTLKYVRYLHDSGWRVTVISPEVSAYQICDGSLAAQLPDDTRVIRTRYANTKRHLSWRGKYAALLALPDVWIGWLPWAVAAGRKLMAEDPVDLIYSTSPHATAHVIARRLARSAGKPWVADFRDPWIEDPPEPDTPNGPIFRRVNRWLEKRVIADCNAVVASTIELRELLRQRYPEVPSDKIGAILNGYDEADFTAMPPPSARLPDAPLRIVHAGNINAEFRDPRALLAALQRLVRNGAIRADEVQLRFVGGGAYAEDAALSAFLASSVLADSVVFLARVPYEESLRELASADLLLLLQASADTVGLVPAKLYEYLRAQRPTLALVHPGAVAEVMRETGGGWAVDPRDGQALDAALREAVAAWRLGALDRHCARLDVLARFDRRYLAGELAAIFAKVSAALR